ncbi:MAG TPA: nuclear transport factor 2 family protein [Solirubrobacterales bacterium]|nr:nuclear transport factor 2 family protein [Solirubrobacterales bacterium]
MKLKSATAAVPAPVRNAASRAFVDALSRGDLEGASACFARHGCLLTPDATAVHGRERIRPLLAQLIARRTRIEVEQSSAIAAGDIVVVRERWRLSAGGAEGARVEQALTATLAISLVEEEWKLAVVAPWGWGTGAP